MRYRKKPVVVEAYQWFGGAEDPHVEWLSGGPENQQPFLRTANGYVSLQRGVWIVTDPSSGDRWPVAPDIFAATYEAVADDETPR